MARRQKSQKISKNSRKEPENFNFFVKIPPPPLKKLQSLLFLNSGIWYDERDLCLNSEKPVFQSGNLPKSFRSIL